MVSLEAISGLGNQKKSLLINELAAVGDSLHPLHHPPLFRTRRNTSAAIRCGAMHERSDARSQTSPRNARPGDTLQHAGQKAIIARRARRSASVQERCAMLTDFFTAKLPA